MKCKKCWMEFCECHDHLFTKEAIKEREMKTKTRSNKMKTITDEMRESIHGEFLKKFVQMSEMYRTMQIYAKQASELIEGNEFHANELISMIATHFDNNEQDQDHILLYMESNWLSHQADLMIKQQEDKGGI